ncbi:MAG: hypothetical protein M1819_007343 [Sarea resinae]|nr:MAG: hypothetical protein M1819_007343 [Sarea resinae]
MPAAVSYSRPSSPTKGITKFTNCRLIKGDKLIEQDLWISSQTGKIIRSQEAFYSNHVIPDQVFDLGGRIISPGLIDVQLNGAFKFDFSAIPDGDIAEYGEGVRRVNKSLVRTGVTSYLPTVTSQRSEVYQKALPYLAPSSHLRIPENGSEILGAHVEGPFISPTKNGIHNTSVLQSVQNGFEDLEACYGAENLRSTPKAAGSLVSRPPAVKIITAAPEIGNMLSLIPEITSRGIVYSIGHSEATYEEASAASAAGAKMITHLFNAMRPLHHRNPGIFGVLGKAENVPRPFFGVISDGIHLHPTTVKIAFNAYPEGFILVTDAMPLVGLPDGIYEWTNGDRIVKKGPHLTLEGTDKIAGSSVTLIECVSNFLNWTGASIPEAISAVTAHPASMLGLEGVKGTLSSDGDADLVVLDESHDQGRISLSVNQVWKFGSKVFDVLEQ